MQIQIANAIHNQFICLIPECEDDITEEDDAVDNSQWSLGDAQFPGVGLESLSNVVIVPFLQDKSTGGNEQHTSHQAEGDVDALVDWGR